VAASGTKLVVYPAVSELLRMFVSNGVTKLSTSESKLKGPVSAPAVVNNIVADFGILIYKFYAGVNPNST
jgi:hypothetical protein